MLGAFDVTISREMFLADLGQYRLIQLNLPAPLTGRSNQPQLSTFFRASNKRDSVRGEKPTPNGLMLLKQPPPLPSSLRAVTKTCNVDRYNVLTGVWTELDAVQTTNCFSDHSGVASDDGTIYLFGGYDQEYKGQTTVVKVEVSVDDELTFSTVASMTIVSAAAFC